MHRNVAIVSSRNAIVNVTKGGKKGSVLNEAEVIDTLTDIVVQPQEHNSTRHHLDTESYQKLVKEIFLSMLHYVRKHA